MTEPNIKMIRIDQRLIHGQGQLWISSLGVNLVICANDAAANNKMQQTLMKTVVPKNIAMRFFTIDRTNEIIFKAAPHQNIFVVVDSPKDALRLVEGGFPMKELNVGNIHAAEGKKKVSQFIHLGEEDTKALKKLRDEHGVVFNTKTSPVSSDGTDTIHALNKILDQA